MIARNSFIIILTQTLSAALGMFALFVISKTWGGYAPGLIGIVWFGLSFVGTFSFVSNLGFDIAHVKRISEGKDLAKCNGTYIAIKLILTAVMVLSLVGGILIWKYALQGDFYDSTRESVIYLFIGYYALVSLAQIPIMTFNSLKKNVLSQMTMLAEPLARAVLFLVVAMAGITGAVLATESGIDIVNLPATYTWPSALQGMQEYIAAHVVGALAVSYFLGGLAMFITGIFFMRKYQVARPDKEYLAMYMKFAVPMMIPVIFTLTIAYFDKVMLGYYWTSEDVGYYFSVQRISTMIAMIPAAIGIVLFPTMSSLHNKYKHDRKRRNMELAKLTRESARFTSMVTVPIICVFVVFSIPIIDIALNSAFRPGSQSMQILTLYTYLSTLMLPYYYLVLGTDRPWSVAKVYAASGISNIILNILLIPRDGLLECVGITGPAGAATATLISSAVMLAGMYFYARQITGKKLWDSRLVLHIVAGIVAGLILVWMEGFFDPIRWYHLALLSATGLGAYLGALWAMGEFRGRELRFFLDTVNPARLARHVRDEVKPR